MSPPPTTHEHHSAATSMREAITIEYREYIVLLMTDSHPAALKVLHQSLIGISIVAYESARNQRIVYICFPDGGTPAEVS